MANQQMSIDYEAVMAAVNQIDVAISDINARNKKFVAILEEKNQQTKNKFAVIKTLQSRVEEEAQNIQQAIQATESIKDAIRRYVDLAEQANDDADFRA